MRKFWDEWTNGARVHLHRYGITVIRGGCGYVWPWRNLRLAWLDLRGE